MRVSLSCIALLTALSPVAALADDPRDPAMRSAAARAHDREEIRRLNVEELARVRARDAQFAEGWAASRATNQTAGTDAGRMRDYEVAMSDYRRDRARYDQQMVEWRRAVAACEAGDYFACRN